MDKIIPILHQIKIALTTFYGWVLLMFTAFWNFISPEKYAFMVVLFAIALDLVWGIIVSVFVHKDFLYSDALRETLKKVSIYGTALLSIYMIEKLIHDEWFIGFRIFCGIAAACELISTSALMLIVKPNMPFIRLFRLSLKGEIDKKLGVNTGKILGVDEECPKKEEEILVVEENEYISF